MNRNPPPAPLEERAPSPAPQVSLQTLRCIPLFQNLSEERLAMLAAACSWKHYETGYTITGARSSGLCLVVAGKALISTYEPGGREVTFQVVGPGGCFGVVDLLLEPSADGSVEAITLQPSLVAKLDRETFFRLLHEDEQFSSALLYEMARMLRRFGQRIVEFSTLTVRGRLLSSLLRMALNAGVQANQARLEPAPRHQVLANYVATHREQITREMSKLQREGMLTKDGAHALVLTDIARLQQMVEESRLKG